MLNTRQLACESGTPLRSNKAKISHEHLAQHHVQVHWKSHQPSKMQKADQQQEQYITSVIETTHYFEQLKRTLNN